MIDETQCAIAVLDRIGVNVKAPKSMVHILMILNALDALHRIGVIHGDARLPNLIVVDLRLVWIDLASAGMPATPAARRLDWIKLVRSILKSMCQCPLPPPSFIDQLCYSVCRPAHSGLLDEEVTTTAQNLRELATAIADAGKELNASKK